MRLPAPRASVDCAGQRTGPFGLIDFDLLAEERAGLAAAAKTLCGRGGSCRTLVGVFQFAVFVARALGRAAMTAASALLSSALLSSAGLLALDGVRR